MLEKSSNFKKGLLYITLSILAYGSMPILIRAIAANKVPPMSQVAMRYLFAFVTASLYFITRKAKFKINVSQLWLIITMSIIGYGLSNLFYTLANLSTEVSNAIFIFFTFSIITPIFALIFLREAINKYNVAGLIIAFIGLGFLVRPNSFATWQVGALFAFLAAVLQSIYLVGRRRLKEVSSELILLSSTFLGMTSVGALALVFEKHFFTPGGIGSLSTNTWILTILFGLLNFSGWYFLSKGFQILTASVGSLLMMWEPVLVAILAFLVYNEVPTIFTLLGAGLITTAVFIVVLKGKS